MAADELKERVARVLAEEAGLALGMAGLDLEVLDITDGVVRVRVRGSCGCCPSSVMAVLMGIEQTLHQRVPEVDYLELAP
jgi:Fe-S cluster biogenesis protein NfuA